MLSKREVRGYVLAATGGGLMQLFAVLTGIPELCRFAAVPEICRVMMAVGLAAALAGLWLAAGPGRPAA